VTVFLPSYWHLHLTLGIEHQVVPGRGAVTPHFISREKSAYVDLIFCHVGRFSLEGVDGTVAASHQPETELLE
jgi:hypothetical protein